MRTADETHAPPRRVWFVAHQKWLTYGANLSLVNLLDGLKGLGVAPRVLVAEAGSLSTALEERGIPTVIHPFRWWSSHRRTARLALGRLWRNLQAVRHLAPRLAADRAELVYTNTSVVPLGAMLAMRLQLPHVWHLREFGDLDHGLIPDWGRAIPRFLIRRADAIISNSHAVQDYYLKQTRTGSSRVIYNGVLWDRDFERLQVQRATRPLREGVFTFVLVGRLVPSKGQDTAIEAVAELRRRGRTCRLLLVGDGREDFIRHCRGLVAGLGLAAEVEFQDYQADPFGAFLAGDAALMCSRLEAMGRVTVEAMAAGLPVIGRATGGTPELIEHERTGLLFDGEAVHLADVMERLIERPDWAAAMGSTACETARRRYSIEVHARAVAGVIHSVFS